MKRIFSLLLAFVLVFSVFQASQSVLAESSYVFEAEDLTRTTNAISNTYTGKGTATNTDYNCGTNVFVHLSASSAAVGDYVEFTLPSVNAGVYKLTANTRAAVSRSIFDISVNSATQLENVDFSYTDGTDSFVADYIEIDCGQITVRKTGDTKLKFTISTARTSGFFVDKINLTYVSELAPEDAEKDVAYYRDNLSIAWSDEFEGDKLNLDDWYYEHRDTPRNAQLHYYNSNIVDNGADNGNVKVEDGKLVITAKMEDYYDEVNGTSYEYTSGGIRTQDQNNGALKLAFKYGVIETRIKMPETSKNALWGSVWMCGVDAETKKSPWPYGGEIDIIEYLSRNPKDEFSSLHYNKAYSSPADDPDGYSATRNKASAGGTHYTFTNNEAFNSGYHTVGIIWTDKAMQFYVDDNIFQTIDISDKQFDAFRKYDFCFLITLPVSGEMVSTSSYTFDNTDLKNPASEATNSMYVDYVRVYQPKKAVANNVTADSITVEKEEGYQYSLDGEVWQDSNVFTSLEADTEYTVYQRLNTGVFKDAEVISEPVEIKTKSENAVDVSAVLGASIRLNEKNGIRFYTNVDKEKIASLKADGYTVELGTLISPADLVTDGELTFDLETNKYIDVKFTSSKYYSETDFSGVVGSIVNIKEENISRDFVGRGYAKVSKNGETEIYYADYVEGSVANHSRSLKTVSKALINDSSESAQSLYEAYKELIDKWANS